MNSLDGEGRWVGANHCGSRKNHLIKEKAGRKRRRELKWPASSGAWVVVSGFGRKQIFRWRKAECELVSAGIEIFRRKVKQKVERQSVEVKASSSV